MVNFGSIKSVDMKIANGIYPKLSYFFQVLKAHPARHSNHTYKDSNRFLRDRY